MTALYPILVVDDDPTIADLLNRAARSILAQLQFIAIHTVEQAVSYLEGLQGKGPRVVLLDINLQASQSGYDFLSQLRAHPQGRLVPVIILSADGDQCRQAYEQGANAFTLKPESLAGWKTYVQQLQAYWFDVATLPKLWFDGFPSPNKSG